VGLSTPAKVQAVGDLRIALFFELCTYAN